ncbi:unnamed protein product [Prorocentrum cordatum]|uniref:Uncharacterized protein n=1 Tax=Prorocentrum cordatum TaxID=2364126 RepID=A0ABN9PRH9_9DINO|nr:unnamed protein product [Polarella glacialis]
MRWVSLVALTLQTTAQVLVIKWAGAERRGGAEPRYLPSTVVLFTEVLKTCVSFALVAAESGGPAEALGVVAGHFSREPVEALKVCVPSLLYTLQNNLMFFSLGRLSAAVQQVTYQLKILTTALLSVLILGRVLTATRWCALLLLLAGIALVQWPRGAGAAARVPGRGAEALAAAGWGDEALGFAAVLAACFTSGLASVYPRGEAAEADRRVHLAAERPARRLRLPDGRRRGPRGGRPADRQRWPHAGLLGPRRMRGRHECARGAALRRGAQVRGQHLGEAPRSRLSSRARCRSPSCTSRPWTCPSCSGL